MNSENDKLPDSTQLTNLNNSLQPQSSSTVENINNSPPTPSNFEDFLTDPLEGLLVGQGKIPISQMTDDELRQFVQEVHQNRMSFQTFKAEVERRAERSPSKAKGVKKEVKLDDMADFF